MAPGALAQVLRGIPKVKDENLIVGYDTSDDACVYRVSDDLALVQTVDFFPPMVDDPFLFGQIAASNALSDVYAMGGRPTHAMNLLCFPSCLDLSIAGEILAGGADKAMEAGCVIAGGHTINDNEPKYGLCVSGFVNPQHILTNSGAKCGDLLILTKPIGTGIIATAVKGGLLTDAEITEATEAMRTLNKKAAEATAGFAVNACTDITGFGIAGHICEMAEGSGMTAKLWTSKIPALPHALEMARMGLIPSGTYRNRDYFGERIAVDSAVAQEMADLLFDPQTSGGLLLSVAAAQAQALLHTLQEEGVPSQIIGEIAAFDGTPVRVVLN